MTEMTKMTEMTQTEREKAHADKNRFETFKVGAPVHWSAGTDTHAGTVVRVTKTRVFVRAVPAKLLNGASSGEPDALQFSPGGFMGHTFGEQRYEFGAPEGPEIVFSRRVFAMGKTWDHETQKRVGGFETTVAKKQGTAMHGSMRSWGVLLHGHAYHYDFNF